MEQTDAFVIVRPSLLTDGKVWGGRKVRVGTDERPAGRYRIDREDVGGWITENLVLGDAARYVGQKVIMITH